MSEPLPWMGIRLPRFLVAEGLLVTGSGRHLARLELQGPQAKEEASILAQRQLTSWDLSQ